MDIKIEIDEVDLTKEEETHNEPEPSTSKASTSLRRTSRVRTTNRLKPQILKVTTKKSKRKKCYINFNVSNNHMETSDHASPPIETNHPLTNPTFTAAPNKLRPKPDCQIRIGNEALRMITSPGRNPILNTHTDLDKPLERAYQTNCSGQEKATTFIPHYSVGTNRSILLETSTI